MIIPGKFSMQVNVPHSKYGDGTYFMATVLQNWLKEHGLHGSYCGGASWGDGTTNGVTNKESHYMVNNLPGEETSTMFKMVFPECKVHISPMYDYSR